MNWVTTCLRMTTLRGQTQMMLIKDAPGGREFIEALTKAIKDLSLVYAGTPDEKARTHLETYIASIEPSIIEAVGADAAATFIEAFRDAVMTEKHKIETSGASRA
jgi:hypothetical protein